MTQTFKFLHLSIGQALSGSVHSDWKLKQLNSEFLIYGRTIIFGQQNNANDQVEPPHIIPRYFNSQGGEPTAALDTTPDIGRSSHKAGPLPSSTPGPTPLRPHAAFLSTGHSEISAPPSLLPPTGTTLSVPPLPLSTVTTFTISSSIGSASVLEASPTSAALPMQNLQTKRHLPLPAAGIAGITIGGSFVLVCFFLLFRWLQPPRRRRIPIPSLPKLENDDLDQEATVQESPLFGPNERFSQRPGLSPAWSWVTFPQNKSATGENNKQAGESPGSSHEPIDSPHPPQPVIQSHRKSSSVYSSTGHFDTLRAPVNSPLIGAGLSSLQQVQGAITRATHRMSTMSLTYGSKLKDTTLTGDDHEVTKRRSKSLRKSRSISVHENHCGMSRASTGLAYDGADVASPVLTMEFMPMDSPSLGNGNGITKVESRTRIQTPYYTTSSYPRISSAIPTTYGVATRVKVGDGASIRGVTSGLKSESQRARETRALTRALGFASPTIGDSIPSPQPTLYPDDSLSVVESKRLLKQRVQKKRGSTFLGDDSQFHQVSDVRRQHLVATPTRSVVAVASGSLVSAEDIKAMASGNSASGPGLAVNLAESVAVNNRSMEIKFIVASSKNEGRTDDKPPRVPSPPPLPSLAQMALEHNNAEAYADYRSPTYSIYNLYEADRKSTLYGGRR